MILSNVSLNELAAAKQEALARYVEGGGGLFLIGGPDLYDPKNGRDEPPLARALPVRFKEKKKTEPNPISLVLVMDKSASMARQKKIRHGRACRE
ncbi:MAG: hypothetical protein M5R36_01455 [Deltaproteobacteria bacterium]|nr:hypothetical protein [Deltaproteobacteria bacterium]